MVRVEDASHSHAEDAAASRHLFFSRLEVAVICIPRRVWQHDDLNSYRYVYTLPYTLRLSANFDGPKAVV